ncbi:MAG: PDZ domain-containing protein [Gemmatimonadota bacterium]
MRTRRLLRNALPVALAAAAVIVVDRPAVGQEAGRPVSPESPAATPRAEAPPAGRGRLGLFLRIECDVDGEAAGECGSAPVVTSVVENEPAAEAGVLPGDTLVALNGLDLGTWRGRRVLRRLEEGVPVRLEIGRETGRREVEVTPTSRPVAGRFDVNIERGAWWPRETGEMRVFRFRSDDGGTAEFYLSPGPEAPPAPERFVVFGEDESGELRLETGRPGIALRTPDGRRIELAELARRASEVGGATVEIASVEVDGEVRHRIVLENAELAERLQSVRANVLEEARVRIDSLRRRQSELARRGERAPAAAAGHAYRYRGRPAGAPGAAEHRLAGAEFRPLTPELAEYFAVDAGLLVLRVIPATPAHELGLRGGDVVVEVGGHETPDVHGFRRLVAESAATGDDLDVKWNRKGVEMSGRLIAD